MNVNSFKFKKQQLTNPFFSNSPPSKHDDKYPSIKPIPQKKVHQSAFKSQHSYQQAIDLARKNRYNTVDDISLRIQNFKSLSLERKSLNIYQKQGKTTIFKKPIDMNKKDPKSYLERQKQSLSPYSNKNKRTLLSKKLIILNNDTIQSQSKDSKRSIKIRESENLETGNTINKKIPENNRKLRVNSTLCKLKSLQLHNSVIFQSSSKTLTGRRKTNELQKNPSNSNAQIVKILIKSQQYRKALTILKQTLNEKNYKENTELIELFVLCIYNMEEYQEVTKMFENVRDMKQKWGSQLYTMVCLSYAKQKLYKNSLSVISKAAQIYCYNPEIFYYKGKMLYHMKKYDLAEKAFKMSNELHQLPETLVCLADCYRKTNQKEQQLQTIKAILCQQKFQFNFKFQDFYIRKFRLLFELERYSQLLEEFQSFQGQNTILRKPQDNGQLQFLYAFSKYKLDLPKIAHEKFQDLVTSQHYESQSLKMLIILEIKLGNFYEASRLCHQVNKMQLKVKYDEIFGLLTSFVEGSINLVRRNFKDGIESLSQVELLMQGHEYSRYKEQNVVKSIEYLCNYESFETVKRLLHLFLGYGLFCVGEYEFCQSAILKQRGIFSDPKYEKNMSYNYTLCEAILSYQGKKYEKVMELLDEAEKIYPQRLEVYFYRAVVMIKLLLRFVENGGGKDVLETEQGQKRIGLIWEGVDGCLNKVSLYGNNTRATILYYKSLLHSYLKDWKQAIMAIDESISQSDQNYWRYYYCKAIILACVHNFEQAIVELNAAITLSDGLKTECFLLRSKCFQIEGKGSQAFADLQQYIALKPNDDQVHKYAGQVLFQNGAFEDALTAFQHHQIPQTPENYDIYLTLAKTLFLTGKFNSAQQKMIIASKLKPSQCQIYFDTKVIGFLDKLVKQIESKTIKDHQPQLIDALKEIFYKDEEKKGKIFHQCDEFLFRALINLYSGEYTKAIQNFQKHLSKKKKMIIFDDTFDTDKTKFLERNSEEECLKTSKQIKIYTNQMKFNIGICHLANGEIQKAQTTLKQIKIDKKENFYQCFSEFKKAVLNQTFLFQNEEILPNKNKFSQFLPSLEILNKQKNFKIKVKICVPFPKVEPPQIFPTFDENLLKTLTIFGIDARPQAPWIMKEDNVIKFTQKISYVSRLDFDESEHSNSRTAIIDLSNSQLKQKKQLQTNSFQKASLFSKRTLKHKNSLKIQN